MEGKRGEQRKGRVKGEGTAKGKTNWEMEGEQGPPIEISGYVTVNVVYTEISKNIKINNPDNLFIKRSSFPSLNV